MVLGCSAADAGNVRRLHPPDALRQTLWTVPLLLGKSAACAHARTAVNCSVRRLHDRTSIGAEGNLHHPSLFLRLRCAALRKRGRSLESSSTLSRLAVWHKNDPVIPVFSRAGWRPELRVVVNLCVADSPGFGRSPKRVDPNSRLSEMLFTPTVHRSPLS
jgi:hypothetical protein